jgi:hypothetical protein
MQDEFGFTFVVIRGGKPMNAQCFLTAVRKRLAPLLALMLLAGVAQAGQRLAIPEEHPGGPYYARLLFGVGYTDTVAVVFYRSPGCVPAAFNLLDVFDPNLDPDACPIVMEGFAIWENAADPAVDPPYQQQLHEVKGTPVTIWFVTLSDLIAEYEADGNVTVADLAAMPTLVVASADSYHEVLQPAGGANIPKVNIVASGTLYYGTSFYMLYEHTQSSFPGITETILRFGD